MNKSEILNTMKLLDIKEVTSNRQAKNGTREFELPIKYPWGANIRVASFKTGYVRNQNGASSNYQLNKCKMDKRYYKYSNGKTHEFDNKLRILIPSERDRLEYLLHYCIKNYYIGHANQVANGDYIPKWKYNDLADAARIDYERQDEYISRSEHRRLMREQYVNGRQGNEEFISRSEHRKLMQEQYINGSRDYSRSKNPEVKVIVNGQRYNVI